MRAPQRAEWVTTGLLWVPVIGVLAASHLRVGLEQPWTGSDLALTVTSVTLAAPLLLRRRVPVLAAALVALALPLQQALGGSLSFGSFVAVLVAAYASGRYGPWRTPVLGTATLMAGVLVTAWQSLPEDGAELVFPAFYVTAAAGLGSVVRRLARQADTLRELNESLARERDTTTRLAVTAERLRLARELHDSVAHTLTATVVQAERCEQVIESDPGAAREASRAIQDAGRRGLAELRATVRVLRADDGRVPASLLDLPALAQACAVEVDLSVVGDPGRVPQDVSHELLRVAQEALTNVAKHSGADRATVRLSIGRGLELEVTDPGPRLQGQLPPGGHGLTGMRERLRQLGGELEVGPHDDGFRVRVVLP